MPDAGFEIQNNDGPQSQVATFVHKYLADRGSKPTPGATPLFGEDAVPHVMTFTGLVGQWAKAYHQSDEALRDSWENARNMRNDVGIMECVEARQRMTAQLDWSVQPEDENHYGQVSLARELERMIKRIRRFPEYRRNLCEAQWYGRYGVQNRYGWVNVNGHQRLIPAPPCSDHPGWLPIHGDKIVFRYDDGTLDRNKGEHAHQMGVRTHMFNRFEPLHRHYAEEATGQSMVKFLTPQERSVCVVHKHMLEDADYFDPLFSGTIHGVGIRSRLYWEYTLSKETLAFLMEYLERSAGGIEIWSYPSGDPKALQDMKQAAAQRQANGRNQVFFPKPVGDDAMAYGMEVVEPGFAGADILQKLIMEYFGHRMKRYILGQTLSSEAAGTGLGSGVADAHLDTLMQIICYDAANLEDSLTHDLLRQIQLFNFPETAGWNMSFKLETQPEDIRDKLESYQIAYQMGAGIPEQDVMQAIGLGMASGDEAVLRQSAVAQPGMGIIQDGDGDGYAGEGDIDVMNNAATMVETYSRDSDDKSIATAVKWHYNQWQKSNNKQHRRELRKSLQPLRQKLAESHLRTRHKFSHAGQKGPPAL